MPKLTKRDPEWERVEAVLAARAAFAAGFRRAKKGSLWRIWEGMSVTVFRSGGFRWCIAERDGPRFSPGGHETEEDAMNALAAELRVGETS